MSSIKFFLILLFFPILLIFGLGWFIYWRFWGKEQNKREKKRKEQQKELLTHIRNFSSVRLKNRSWQKSLGKYKKKRKKKTKKSKNYI